MSDFQSQNRSFAQILLEKMSKTEPKDPFSPRENTVFHRENDQNSENVVLNCEIFRAAPQVKHSYKQAVKRQKFVLAPAQKAVSREKSTMQEPIYIVNDLSVVAQLALSRLLNHAEGCTDCTTVKPLTIRLSEVKRAYRRLARDLHPDLNPQADTRLFAEAKELVDLLIKELQGLSQAKAA